ncbi:putative toxin-antitoxin system antitoxin component, TIGR02293 family [Arachidicoccus rhizosphaerae]|uniref:Putative toxin-antitoxin system antitoxin component, TIGR02293 family n=1 Tax=Arachidicoccus rhizosphaerae TaxID=551991 RepID=A0A1H3VIH4_9BACT|nr:antitoxin Xre/MbcA/ParS toxin-binding domain-containing protein [Arachidicoccus rhizosphaerae]SDZ74570.1 putative toxin-antitoxin system antitoxin component, TIGR02293 family [Arachidicoccus rhizosphaerae]
MESTRHINEILFQQYQKELSNPVAMVLKAADGLAISAFDALLQVTALSKNQLAAFIDATPKTIDNYRTRQRNLGRTESEQILQLLGLYKKGQEIFGNSKAFNEWMSHPAIGLGGIKAFDLLYTAGGINLVMEELLRIEYGALA